MELLATIFAAIGLAAGIAMLTTLTARSEQYPNFAAGSFVLSALVVFGVLAWADLPKTIEFWLGALGFGIALLSLMGLKGARHFERRSGY